MKRIVAICLLTLVMGFIFINLFGGKMNLESIDFSKRDSNSYTNRSVNGNSEEVVFGESEGLENSAANTVAAIVADYRGFDTLGEVSVLLVASLGVTFLVGGIGLGVRFKYKPSFVLKIGARIVFGVIFVFGVYMYAHGHLTPGGGFPGGAIIAASFLLLYLADDSYRANLHAFKILEGTAGSLFVLVGIGGLLFANYFLQNYLPTGTIGNVFSAGILPIINILIGHKVGSELVGIVDNFMKKEEVSL